MKQIVNVVIGLSILLLAACASAPEQTPTPAITQTLEEVSPTPEPSPPGTEAVPTGTAGIPVTGEELTNTSWRLTSFTEQGVETPVIESAPPTLQLEEMGRAVGSGGCNMFSTQYVVQDSTITFDLITSTEIACTEEGVMEQEQRYFQMLQAADRVEQTGDQLILSAEDGTNLLTFVRDDNSGTATPVSNLLCSTVDEGANPGWTLCQSQDYGFEVQYPPAAEMIDHTATSARINLPFPPDVNLTEKYLTMEATQNSDTCTSPLTEGRPSGSFTREPVQINELEFTKESGQEAATGSVYNWEAYSIQRNDACISLSFVLRSFQPALAATPPAEFDYEEESQVFTEIVSTFEWLEPPDESTPTAERIEFAPGTTSATVINQLEASGSKEYVLRASAGQTLSVELAFTEGAAILAVWGEDGTVLLSDHAEASSFQRVLPATQDYHILVKGRADGSTSYSMTIIVPPLP